MKRNYYKLILDESGTFSKNDEKYIVIGGFLFNEKDSKYIDGKFSPMHENICQTFGIEEMHGCENKKLFKYLCVSIGSDEKILPVVIVVDKNKSEEIQECDSLSEKYNIILEHLLFGMIYDNYISENDKITILIDNINLSKKENIKFKNYLSNKYKFVNKIEQGDSKEHINLQIADLIVNKFSKKQFVTRLDKELVLLHPVIYSFLEETMKEYIRNE